MKHSRYALLALSALLASCSTNPDKGSIAQLQGVTPDLTDVRVDSGVEKAMQGYEKFLAQQPDSAMAPEAMRRLADLKIQKDYGTAEDSPSRGSGTAPAPGASSAGRSGFVPPVVAAAAAAPASLAQPDRDGGKAGKGKKGKGKKESSEAFEKRATQSVAVKGQAAQPLANPDGSGADVESAGAAEAVALYKKLLAKYPNYERNDQVLYQLSRAYEELGQTEDAMAVMDTIAKNYPNSRYFDEVQFRRGEYFFSHKKFVEAEDAFKAVVDIGPGSSYYELADYKLGWTHYKQALYEESVNRFIALLDYKAKTGYDFDQTQGTKDQERIDDTFSAISLAFSNLGGSDAVNDYFAKNGKRSYEVNVYRNLGDYYLDKRRYSDAAATFKAFVKRNPYHKVAPIFDRRVIEIYARGGFPELVIDANKAFVVNYGLKSEYWKHFDVKAYPEVIGYVKTSLKELASHYHALYQDKTLAKDKPQNFQEAMRWYRDFLSSFPKEAESPGINFLMAGLLLENKSYGEAAVEYEHTAYDYPYHAKAQEAGYDAVYAYRERLSEASEGERDKVRRDVIRSSLKFADTFPKHDKAAVVMSAAVDDIYGMKDYAFAVTTGHKLLDKFPDADEKIRRAAWLVVAHASFELGSFKDAEEGFQNVLQMTAQNDKSRPDLVEDLAASVYKQGEEANKRSDFKAAADHFLRVAKVAPSATIRPTADYDGATALIQLKDWDRAAGVLTAFRKDYAGNKLQPEVTKKLAYVYKESGKAALAAAEYERIETETKDVAVRREALQTAGDLYVEAKETDKAIAVYRRYVGYFPKPAEAAIEIRSKIADILKARSDMVAYMDELRQIVAADAGAGGERTDRTRYLGGTSALALTEPQFDQYAAIKLVNPLKKSLAKKTAALKTTKESFEKLLKYEVGDVTAAATYYIAELYRNFGQSVLDSERPPGLSDLEKEQYTLTLEDQADPFTQKAIDIHQKNVALISQGIYDPWIDKSFAALAKLMPARYAKFEESSGYIDDIKRANYAELTEQLPPPPPKAVAAAPAQGAAPAQQGAATTEVAPAQDGAAPQAAAPAQEGAPAQAATPVAPAPAAAPAQAAPAQAAAPAEAATPAQAAAPAQAATPAAPAPAAAPVQAAPGKAAAPAQQENNQDVPARKSGPSDKADKAESNAAPAPGA